MITFFILFIEFLILNCFMISFIKRINALIHAIFLRVLISVVYYCVLAMSVGVSKNYVKVSLLIFFIYQHFWFSRPT